MGHASLQAALIYLHGSDERQQAIAAALSRRVAAGLGGAQPYLPGTQRARRPEQAS